MSGFSRCNMALIGPKKFIESILPYLCAPMGEEAQKRISTIAAEAETDMGGALQALYARQPELILYAPPPSFPFQPLESALAAYYERLRQTGAALPPLLAFLPEGAGTALFQTLGEDILSVSAGEAIGPGAWRLLTGENLSSGDRQAIRLLTAAAAGAAAEARSSPSHTGQEGFSPRHQAVMFGLLAREALTLYGQERGGQLLERAVARYGNERGSRMAQRALQNGDPLDMASYFAYGEWSWQGDFSQSVLQKEPYYIERIEGCPWYLGWKESGLSEYSGYYCRGVDAAILHGFHPALRLKTATIAGVSGCGFCEFHWKDARMTPEAEQRQRQLGQRLGNSCKKDFAYHTAHLYSTLTRCAIEEEEQTGRRLAWSVWQGFSEYASCRKLLEVLALAGADFTRI